MTEPTKTAITRREFATRAALAGAAATLGATPSPAQTATPAQTAPAAVPADVPQTESSLRVQTILAIYGNRFSESQKTNLLKISSTTQKSLDHLRTYKVENSDEPALHLKPLMEREKKPSTAHDGVQTVPPTHNS